MLYLTFFHPYTPCPPLADINSSFEGFQTLLSSFILQKASAGYGQYVDDADIEMVYVKESVPENAGFGIHVSGDSMEPKFHNGDLVWVEKKDTLNSGDIGVFYLDGNIYIKRLEYGNGMPCLKSLNRKYKAIPIRDTSVFTVWGKVL